LETVCNGGVVMKVEKRKGEAGRTVGSVACRVWRGGYWKMGVGCRMQPVGQAAAFLVLCLLCMGNVYAQDQSDPQDCPEQPQTSGSHNFRRLGETIEIPIQLADCQAVDLTLHWSNGRNNGSNFNVTFRDNNNRPVYSKHFSGFLTGTLNLPLANFYSQQYWGSSTLISVPASVTIQAVSPFASPARLSYTVTRISRSSKNEKKVERKAERNEVVNIRTVVRLIGASRLPLIQMELKTDRPFPVREQALKLQIGKQVFVDELSGEHTGRTLILSLTPAMFAELQNGDEIVALFDKPAQDVWNFGKLDKSRLDEGRRQ
jgi:hypothetical protein